MPPNRFESEVESFLEGSHGDRTHIKRADHHTVTPLCGTLLPFIGTSGTKLAQHTIKRQFWALFRLQGEYSHARSLTKQSRAKIVTHRARQHKRSKETSPLREVLRAVVKHFSPTRVHKSQFWPFSTEQGRYFFHCGCMPGTGAIRWGDISFRTRPRRPIEPPILTRRTRDQQTGGTGVMGTEGHGRGAGGRRRGLDSTASAAGVEGAGGSGGPGRGAGGWRQGQGGPRDRPLRAVRLACGDLAGGRALRRPEHQRCHKQHHTGTNGERAGRRPPAHTAARPHKTHAAPGDQTAPETPAALNKHRHRKRKAYSPRNALIAGISRTACTRPAR